MREGHAASDQSHTMMQDWLARELHDAVSSQLTTMLVEMELLRRREGMPAELERFQVEIRTALMSLRKLLHELRRQAPPDGAIAAEALERKVRGAIDWAHAVPGVAE